jgi:membrane protein DedA with SNARE-associated domain
MTRGSVIIAGVILVAGAGNALAMSASFWAGTALFGHLARLHDRRRAESTASLRFAKMRYHRDHAVEHFTDEGSRIVTPQGLTELLFPAEQSY